MVQFRKHIISYGDTLQAIAQRQYGDMSLWTEIAEFNGLKYPYIVDTLEEKERSPETLVTIGDTLLLRSSDDEQAGLISQLKRTSEYDQEEIFALALGKDLAITPNARQIGDEGSDSDVLGLQGTPTGQLKTARGIDNLKQALYIRLITPLGSYVGHPRFGSNIHQFIGKKNTEKNAILLALEIERTIRTDGRVTHVEPQGYRINGNSYTAGFTVYTLDIEEAFDFIVQTRETGAVVLLDSFNEGFM